MPHPIMNTGRDRVEIWLLCFWYTVSKTKSQEPSIIEVRKWRVKKFSFLNSDFWNLLRWTFETRINMKSRDCVPWSLHRRFWNVCPHKTLHSRVYNSYLHTCQNVFSLFCLAMLWGMWSIGSQTRGCTHVSCIGSVEP